MQVSRWHSSTKVKEADFEEEQEEGQEEDEEETEECDWQHIPSARLF
jgi:hypothetical protein